MADEEITESTEEQSSETQTKTKEPLFSKMGLFLALIVMIIWTAILVFYFQGIQKNMSNFSSAEEEKIKEQVKKVLFDAETAPEVELKDITQFVRTNISGTQGRMLACSLVLKLGMTEDETKKADPKNYQLPKDFNLREELKEGEPDGYEAVLTNMTKRLTNLVIKQLSQFDFQQLSSAETKSRIASFMKDRANERFKKLGMEPRVAEVYWTDFTFSGD